MSHRPIIGSRLVRDIPSSPRVLADEDTPRRPYRDIIDNLVDSWLEWRRRSPEAQGFLRRRRLWEPAILDPPVPPIYPPGDLFHVFNPEGIPTWVRVPAPSLNSRVVAGMTRAEVQGLLGGGAPVEMGGKGAGR